ncbi:BING4CT-domain-containing protein [Imleria badia]|nr:BING4CT-domain-containing protein [Imleria badia]
MASMQEGEHGIPTREDLLTCNNLESTIRKPTENKTRKPDTCKNKPGPSFGRTLAAVTQNTSLPRSLRPSSPPLDDPPKPTHIKDLKLRTQLIRQAAHAARAKMLLQGAELLLTENAGWIETENEMEKTWRVGQDEIVRGAGQEAAKGCQEWRLDGGPYRSRYAGSMGYIITFDWQTGMIHAELQLQETCRDITTNPFLRLPRRKTSSFMIATASIASTKISYRPYTTGVPPLILVACEHRADGTSFSKLEGCDERGGAEVERSAKGTLEVATCGSVNVCMRNRRCKPRSLPVAPPLYLTRAIPHQPLTSVRFCPLKDILTVGRNAGLSSLLIPGSGEPNFYSNEADPFEGKKRRQEGNVKGLLDKIQPDMIVLDPDLMGLLAPPSKLTTAVNDKHDISFVRLPRLERLRIECKVDETELNAKDDADGADDDGKKKSKEEREKRKMRGRGKSLKRYLRKQRKNVIDSTAAAIRAKLEKQREERQVAKAIEKGEIGPKKPSALDRLNRS